MPKFTEHRPSTFRGKPKKIKLHLDNALNGDNPGKGFPPALLEILREYGITSIAEKAGTRRETLYRSLGGKHRAPFDHVVDSLAAIGLKFVVVSKGE